LFTIGGLFIFRIVSSNKNSLLLSTLFQKKDPTDFENKTEFTNEYERREYLEKKMKDEFLRRKAIAPVNFWVMLCCCKRSVKRQIEVGMKKVDTELDLQRFI